jgi:dihydrofolate reductase
MKSKCSVFIATSLDGFIARPDGNIDWLESASSESGDEDFGYKSFMSSVDALIMGRNTFEKVLSFSEWPYGDKQVVVLSSRLRERPDAAPTTVKLSGGSPQQVVDGLVSEGLSSFYVDGGVTIQRFLNAGSIDEMSITTIPILLGKGIPLFGRLDSDIKLELLSSQSYLCGFVQTKYRIDKE